VFIILGAFRTGHYVGAGVFILSLCVIFAGFANHVMKMSFSDAGAGDRLEEKPAMVWPQYALLSISLVLCFWIPDSLNETIVHAVNSIGGGL
jgi:hydrogenase-4 component F